jgi:cytochrome c-type biogenesis protein
VIIVAWLLAFTISGLGKFYNAINVELWLRRVVALLFIGVGIYYVVQVFF